jgi:hypothetical protein
LWKITHFFEIIFEEFIYYFFVAGPDPAQKETGPKSAKNKIRPTFYKAGLYSPKEQLAGYCAEHSNQVIIISWLLCAVLSNIYLVLFIKGKIVFSV